MISNVQSDRESKGRITRKIKDRKILRGVVFKAGSFLFETVVKQEDGLTFFAWRRGQNGVWSAGVEAQDHFYAGPGCRSSFIAASASLLSAPAHLSALAGGWMA